MTRRLRTQTGTQPQRGDVETSSPRVPDGRRTGPDGRTGAEPPNAGAEKKRRAGPNS